MQRMQTYMPAPHRAFLTHLMGSPHSIRALVIKQRLLFTTEEEREGEQMERKEQVARELSRAYDETIGEMKRFRDAHMRVVARYIVSQARKAPSGEWEWMGLPAAVAVKKVVSEEGEKEELKGTGGTALVSFLKACRARTVEALLDVETTI